MRLHPGRLCRISSTVADVRRIAVSAAGYGLAQFASPAKRCTVAGKRRSWPETPKPGGAEFARSCSGWSCWDSRSLTEAAATQGGPRNWCGLWWSPSIGECPGRVTGARRKQQKGTWCDGWLELARGAIAGVPAPFSYGEVTRCEYRKEGQEKVVAIQHFAVLSGESAPFQGQDCSSVRAVDMDGGNSPAAGAVVDVTIGRLSSPIAAGYSVEKALAESIVAIIVPAR